MYTQNRSNKLLKHVIPHLTVKSWPTNTFGVNLNSLLSSLPWSFERFYDICSLHVFLIYIYIYLFRLLHLCRSLQKKERWQCQVRDKSWIYFWEDMHVLFLPHARRIPPNGKTSRAYKWKKSFWEKRKSRKQLERSQDHLWWACLYGKNFKMIW